jgi:hypothetical protein
MFMCGMDNWVYAVMLTIESYKHDPSFMCSMDDWVYASEKVQAFHNE